MFQNSISEFAASHSGAVKPRSWAFKPYFREVYPKIRAWSSRYREVGKSRTRFRYCDGLPDGERDSLHIEHVYTECEEALRRQEFAWFCSARHMRD
jgi:hypothetical protein